MAEREMLPIMTTSFTTAITPPTNAETDLLILELKFGTTTPG